MEPHWSDIFVSMPERGTMRPMVILSSAPVLLVLDIFNRGSNRGASVVGLRFANPTYPDLRPSAITGRHRYAI